MSELPANSAEARRHAGTANPGASRGMLGFLVAPGIIGLVFLALPLVALLVRAPWSTLGSLLGRENVLTALRLSLITATSATALSLVFGVPLAWLLARARLPGIRVLRAVVTLPLVLPPVVGGVALLYALGRNEGVLGRYLNRWLGVSLLGTTPAVVIAETFVAMPFLVVTVEGAFQSVDQGLEEAAATLGASSWTVFRRITLPAVVPSLAAGAILCWARALGEFGATITFAGNLPGATQTMPLAIYSAFQLNPDSAIALSLVLLLVAVVVLVALRDRWLRRASAL